MPLTPDGASRWSGGPAGGPSAPESGTGESAESVSAAGPSAVAFGGCHAWPLPLDATCAAEARKAYREAAEVAGLPDDLAYDGMTMASELAANTLHARDNVELDTGGRWAVAGGPEIWVYLRQHARSWELVCKVYDSLAGWRPGAEPSAAREASLDAVGGRGLQVVAGLSGGRWGHHLTRSRFGGWKVSGKAVWFAQRVPAGSVPVALRQTRIASATAARRLEELLTARGLGPSLLRIDERGRGMSVLSVRRGLTLWCGGDAVWWQARTGAAGVSADVSADGYARRALTDLEEVSEQVVCICEEMDRDARPGRPGQIRFR